MDKFIFLPTPRSITALSGSIRLSGGKFILCDSSQNQELLFAATRWQRALLKNANIHWEIITSKAIPAAQIGLTLRVDPGRVPYRQGYELTIGSESIRITG